MSIRPVSLEKFYSATDCYAVNILRADANSDSVVSRAELDHYLKNLPDNPASKDRQAEIAGTRAFFDFARLEQQRSLLELSPFVTVGLTTRGTYRVFESWERAQRIIRAADTNGDQSIDAAERSKLSNGMLRVLDNASLYADFY